MSNLGEALWRMSFEKGYSEGYAEGYAEGYSEGYAEGYAEEKIKAAARYYRRGIITAEYAASSLDMTVEEFLEKVEQSENVVPENA